MFKFRQRKRLVGIANPERVRVRQAAGVLTTNAALSVRGEAVALRLCPKRIAPAQALCAGAIALEAKGNAHAPMPDCRATGAFGKLAERWVRPHLLGSLRRWRS